MIDNDVRSSAVQRSVTPILYHAVRMRNTIVSPWRSLCNAKFAPARSSHPKVACDECWHSSIGMHPRKYTTVNTAVSTDFNTHVRA